MPPATSPHLGISFLQTGQQNAELSVNEFLAISDSTIFCRVKDFDPSPPATPVNGDRFIVSASPTGIWTGKANQLAIYYQGWRYVLPQKGMSAYVDDLNGIFFYNGSAWTSAGVIADLTGGISASYSQAEVTGIYNKVNALLAGLRALGIVRT